MRRGTTPTITLVLDEPLTGAEVYATVKQGTVTITKTQCEISEDGTVLSVALTQEDTLSLTEGLAEVQLRYKVGGNAYATNIVKVPVDGILMDGAI